MQSERLESPISVLCGSMSGILPSVSPAEEARVKPEPYAIGRSCNTPVPGVAGRNRWTGDESTTLQVFGSLKDTLTPNFNALMKNAFNQTHEPPAGSLAVLQALARPATRHERFWIQSPTLPRKPRQSAGSATAAAAF